MLLPSSNSVKLPNIKPAGPDSSSLKELLTWYWIHYVWHYPANTKSSFQSNEYTVSNISSSEVKSHRIHESSCPMEISWTTNPVYMNTVNLEISLLKPYGYTDIQTIKKKPHKSVNTQKIICSLNINGHTESITEARSQRAYWVG